MLPRNHPDRIQITFDDRRLVANAGLLLPATLARHPGLPELVRQRLDLGDAPGRANTSDKMMTMVASALAGGDCIDDADVLRTGGTACTLGGTVKAPSTLGTFLRSFRWGHVRQLDRVSRELLARAWQAGAGPGDGPLTIDLDSTICETYGLAKEGARHHGYTGKRGYHPLLAIAAGTGDVLMSRLREGRANTARGAAHFLRETVGRVRYAGANGRLTLRADSGFYTHGVVSVCRKMDVRFSITIRQHKSLHNLIEAIPEDAWTPIPYRSLGHQQESFSNLQFVPPTDIFTRMEPSPLGPLRRQRRLAGRPDDGPQPGPLDGADRSGRADSHHQDPPAAVLLPGRTAHPLGTPVDPASSGLRQHLARSVQQESRREYRNVPRSPGIS